MLIQGRVCSFILATAAASGLLACGTSEAPTSSPEIAPSAPELELAVDRFEVNVGSPGREFLENTYLVRDLSSGDAVIIDPGARSEALEALVGDEELTVRAVLNKHGHFDHVGANAALRERFGVEVLAHAGDEHLYRGEDSALVPTTWLSEESMLRFGALEVTVLHTPGHTPGSVCYLIDSFLFSGDTLFRSSIGRTWDDGAGSAEANKRRLVEGIRRELLALPDSTLVYPGHGGRTMIGRERGENPFLK